MRISRKHYKDADQFIYLEVKLINHNNLGVHIGQIQQSWGSVTLSNVIPMEKIDILITDSEAEPVFIEGLEEMGVQVIIAKQFKKEVREYLEG